MNMAIFDYIKLFFKNSIDSHFVCAKDYYPFFLQKKFDANLKNKLFIIVFTTVRNFAHIKIYFLFEDNISMNISLIL